MIFINDLEDNIKLQKKKKNSMAQTFLRIISKRDMTLKEKVKACSIGSVSEKNIHIHAKSLLLSLKSSICIEVEKTYRKW